ncbi:EfeM/EfeO family lipoprotein [Compostimonas suwonensis]|uniref:Iron uptake system component EfeO n=1 Tax=Compostimonas suwonensis TaxID=1048394 RepID=A0A2M9C4W1_9MICO|nr:EfeM/EfeO family lipoprotein [Compostimonas suwonensis]PJJ65565.1 iron uptake system component EfeO [Compostimonas suwonensis]
MSRLSTRQSLGIVFGIVGLVIVVGVVATIVTRPAATSAAEAGTVSISIGTDRCAPEWTSSDGGPLTFSATNTSIAPMELYLVNPQDDSVYAELEGIGSGATQNLDAVIGDGDYRFACLPDDGAAVMGPTVTIAGSGQESGLTPAIAPVTGADLTQPIADYQSWIAGRLPALQTDVRTLDAAIAANEVATARVAWITAHTDYEALGAAYGAFGDADGAINGTPAPGLTALDDPDLTGFHKIEALLWSGAAPADAAPAADRLVADVDGLAGDWENARIAPLDIGLRAHEILENAIEFELTGATDAGSGSSLATIDANLTGTRGALDPLRTILSDRGYDLDETDSWLDRSTRLVESFRAADGSWTPLAQLDPQSRRTLDATLSQTVELLAPIAAICDVRRPVS